MKKFIFLSITFLLLFGFLNNASAQGFNLIVCDGGATDPCTFGHLVTLAQNVINALILFSTFLAVASFAYAGFLLLTSGGNEQKKNQAKEVFRKVLIGYLWILGAWLLVYTITSLLAPGFSLLGAPR